MTLSKELIEAIKAITPTKDIDGKTYFRIDRIILNENELVIYKNEKPIMELQVYSFRKGDTLVVDGLDILWGSLNFSER